MKIKTDNLSGTALDYAVAIALGATNFRFDTVATFWLTLDGKDIALSTGWSRQQSYYPSSNWEQAGAIIDANSISVIRCDDDYGVDADGFCNNKRIPVWCASQGQQAYTSSSVHQHHDQMYQIFTSDVCYGPTALIAALRCFVARKLGNEVDVPKEILK